MLSKVIMFLTYPSFRLVLLDFALATTACTIYSLTSIPFILGCAIYWYILGIAAVILAWNEKK